MAPGLFMQALTTAEPDDSQLEVAIAALNKAVELDIADEANQEEPDEPVAESGAISS